ncbi:hypothetical protein CK500_11895 [Halorubrum salipaludis]|uniref:Uncharacterized protein n=1 Tax=Halorubrum salipaludis TaxID=2032630 RepID=A0A2A2FDY7_9EURY|nr:hypothetical protein [Halorubrum salipaludis]PAU82829.1 hypothetical protein CK500_11895 [Halorubrum salipaludis]
MTGYYDYVLGLIPAALIGVTAALNLVGLSLTAALPGGALVAGAVMAHAIFVKAPVTDEARVRNDRAAGGSPGRSGAPRRGRSRTDGAD